MKQKCCVIFCRCGGGDAEVEKMDSIGRKLKNLDIQVYELHDLCAMACNEKDVLVTIGHKFEKKIIIACYSRAVKNIFRQNHIETGDFDVYSFKEMMPEEIIKVLETDYGIHQGKATYLVQVSSLEVPAWYPVIDESLCTLCGRCAKFCLFGVYSYDRKSLRVIDPLACKNNCPACGRTCPASAIMFPRLAEHSVLSGAEPGENKKVQGDRSLLMTLNQRNINRRNIFRQGVMELAEEERAKALREFKNGMGIIGKND